MSELIEVLTPSALFEPGRTIAAPLLASAEYPWEALAGIREFIEKMGPTLPAEEYDSPRDRKSVV